MAEFSLDGGKTRIVTEQCFDSVKTKGRPRKKLNDLGRKIIEQLASFMCTEEEIASFLGVTVEVLKNESNEECFSECIKNGREKGKASLRMNQFRLSKTNAAMAIWLGKQYLGQADDAPTKDNQKNAGNANELRIVVEKKVVDLTEGIADADNQL